MIPRTQTGSRYELMLEHRHWASFGMKFEGGHFNRLQELVAAVPFDSGPARLCLDELRNMAYSKGWTDQDCYAFRIAGRSDAELADDPDLSELKERYAADPDAGYTRAVERSIAALARASVTEEARAFVQQLGGVIPVARRQGRELCRDHGEPEPAPAGIKV